MAETETRTWGEALAPEIEAWGPMPDDAMDLLLWEATAFPMAPPEYVCGQLAELRRLSGGSVAGALFLARLQHDADYLLYMRPLALAVPATVSGAATGEDRCPNQECDLMAHHTGPCTNEPR